MTCLPLVNAVHLSYCTLSHKVEPLSVFTQLFELMVLVLSEFMRN